MYGPPSLQENSELEALLNSLLEEPPHKTALQNEKVWSNPVHHFQQSVR